MNVHIEQVVFAVCQRDNLLHSPIVIDFLQAHKATDAVVNMNNVVSRMQLLNFLQGKCVCLRNALGGISVVTLENLMVGIYAGAGVVIDKALVQRSIHANEVGIFALVGKNVAQTLQLLVVVAEDIGRKTIF